MPKIYDEVLKQEVYVQEKITPEIGKDIPLEDIKPDIEVSIEDIDDDIDDGIQKEEDQQKQLQSLFVRAAGAGNTAMKKNCRVLQSGFANITQSFHNANSYDRHGKYWNYYHGGLDLVKNPHYLDYITPHTAGTVVGIRTNCKGFEPNGSYGNYVLVKHKNGYFTMYAHLAVGTIKVKLGQKVTRSTVLAYMDNTGTSYGGHLHWEVRNKSGVRIDPEPYLNADLPNMSKVTFRTYDLKKKAWLPAVKNGTAGVNTAGNAGHKMGAITIKSDTLKRYRIKRRGLKGWEDATFEYGTTEGLYAGNKKRAITAIAIKDKKLAYKVQFLDGTWSSTVYGKNYDIEKPKTGYAGDGKKPIAQIMIWVI